MRRVIFPLICLLSLLCSASLGAAPRTVGRFVLSDSLPWERLDPETDKALEGLCVAVKSGDGVSNVIVFGEKPIPCEPGQLRATIKKGVTAIKKKLNSREEVVFSIEGRAWRGVRVFDPDEKMAYYFGLTYKGPEAFRIYILRRSADPIPDDLREFLRRIKVGNSFPKSPSTPFIIKGNALVSEKRYRAALRQFEKAVEKDRTHWPVYYYKGLCLRRMKDYAGAERSLKKALLFGEHPPVYVQLARTFAAAGNTGEARRAFANALEMNPESDEALLRRGNMYLRRKQYDRALSDFEKCLAINPCNRAANVNSSQILFHIKKEPHRAAA